MRPPATISRRDVIRLMVDLLFIEDHDVLTNPGIIRTIYDPTAGTGGMLSVAEEKLSHEGRDVKVRLFGQELNPESYAICKADMLIKGQDVSNIAFGNTLSEDGHADVGTIQRSSSTSIRARSSSNRAFASPTGLSHPLVVLAIGANAACLSAKFEASRDRPPRSCRPELGERLPHLATGVRSSR